MEIKSYGQIEKASKLAEGEVEFVVSTGALDSHGERINVDGISTKDYMKNPVVLWGHDGMNLPIAKATKVWKEGGKLMARAKFYMKDAFAAKVYGYIVDGYLNAVSIGGMVEAWGADGLTISALNMKEFSVVSVPANPEATVSLKSLDGNQKAELRALANAYARKTLEANGVSAIQKDVEVLETLVATLKVLANGEAQDVEADEPTKLLVTLRQAQAVDKQVEGVIRSIKLKKEITNE